MSRSRLPVLSALLAAGALSGCTAVPEPLVAYPGPNKTAEVMQQDDAACRQQAASPAAPASATTPSPTVPAAAPPAATSAAAPVAGTPAPVAPESLYFQCMAARGNIVAAAPAAYPATYAPAVYAGYGPGLWGDPFWYGYYGAPFHAWGGGWGLGLGWGWGGAYRAGWRGPGYWHGRGPGYWRGGPGHFGHRHFGHGGFGGGRGFGGRGGRH